MADEMGVMYLGGIELDPRLGQSCDAGKSFISEFPDSRVSNAYLEVVKSKHSMFLHDSSTLAVAGSTQ